MASQHDVDSQAPVRTSGRHSRSSSESSHTNVTVKNNNRRLSTSSKQHSPVLCVSLDHLSDSVFFDWWRSNRSSVRLFTRNITTSVTIHNSKGDARDVCIPSLLTLFDIKDIVLIQSCIPMDQQSKIDLVIRCPGSSNIQTDMNTTLLSLMETCHDSKLDLFFLPRPQESWHMNVSMMGNNRTLQVDSEYSLRKLAETLLRLENISLTELPKWRFEVYYAGKKKHLDTKSEDLLRSVDTEFEWALVPKATAAGVVCTGGSFHHHASGNSNNTPSIITTGSDIFTTHQPKVINDPEWHSEGRHATFPARAAKTHNKDLKHQKQHPKLIEFIPWEKLKAIWTGSKPTAASRSRRTSTPVRLESHNVQIPTAQCKVEPKNTELQESIPLETDRPAINGKTLHESLNRPPVKTTEHKKPQSETLKRRERSKTASPTDEKMKELRQNIFEEAQKFHTTSSRKQEEGPEIYQVSPKLQRPSNQGLSGTNTKVETIMAELADLVRLSSIEKLSCNIQGTFEASTSSSTLDGLSLQVVSVIEEKSYGEILLCKIKGKGKMCIIKGINKRVKDPTVERKVLEKLKHPFIIPYHGFYESPDRGYFILDYVACGEMYYHVAVGPPISKDRVRLLGAQIVFAVQYLHSQGYIHCDIKLENLLLSDVNGHVMLSEFGRCVAVGDVADASHAGTLEYFAPEILNHQPVSFKTDWWAVGIVLYEMLYRDHPFFDEDRTKMCQNIMTLPLHLDSGSRSHKLLHGLLERDPENRLSHGQDILRQPFFVGIDPVKILWG